MTRIAKAHPPSLRRFPALSFQSYPGQVMPGANLTKFLTFCIVALEGNNLIALDTDGFIDWHRVEAFAAEVDFCPSDKKCQCLTYFIEVCKIEIAAIHDIYGPHLDDQFKPVQ